MIGSGVVESSHRRAVYIHPMIPRELKNSVQSGWH